MTEKQLKSIIDRLNKGKLKEQLFLRPLVANVDFAYYWNEKPTPEISICSGDGPYKFYFVRDSDGRHVGCVLDMTSDLHWYILPIYRKNGYLSNALKSDILPHLFKTKKEQRITIDQSALDEKDAEASLAVAIRLGFISIGGMEYILQKKHFKPLRLKEERPNGMKDERLEIMRKRANYLSRSLWQLSNETEAGFGKSKYTIGMEKLVEEIRKLTWMLEDAFWEYENQTPEQE